MEEYDQDYRQKLLNQIEEQYGKLVYTYTCHLKEANILKNRLNKFNWAKIIFSALSTGGSCSTILVKTHLGVLVSAIMSAITSAILLIINTYLKGVDLEGDANNHISTSNELWKIREEYISLLTEFEILSSKEIVKKRDDLTCKTAIVYSFQLQTSKKAYKLAKRALKSDEEQFFTQDEINAMLPRSLRK
ncbi:MAG: SLATT domain-containing protein [Ligilactobacillus ruminis]